MEMVKVLISTKPGVEKIKILIIIGMKILIIKIQAILIGLGAGIYEFYKSGNKPY
jgi:hypothetical protein